MSEAENEKSYEQLWLGKKQKLDPTKNHNYRRLQGLSRLIMSIKKEKSNISNNDSYHESEKNQLLRGFNTVLEYYEVEIKKVHKLLPNQD